MTGHIYARNFSLTKAVLRMKSTVILKQLLIVTINRWYFYVALVVIFIVVSLNS